MTGLEAAYAFPVVRRRFPIGQFATGFGAIAALAFIAAVVGKSQAVEWSAIPAFMIDPSILGGLLLTLQLTVAAMLIGIALGAVLSAMAISGNIVLQTMAAGFVWCFRGVPLIVQIFFWFNIALFVPDLKLGGIDISVNAIVTPAVAGLLALGLHEAANMSEVIRAGLLSVDSGQHDACRALGMTRGQALRGIVLPQAIRVIIPPTGNQAIGMLKASAIVSVIGMEDLLTRAQHIYARNFLVIELLIVASIWYLAVTTIATVGQHYLERAFARGYGRRNAARANAAVAAEDSRP
ncbi:amino acid ABC transporter permease [Kaistia soli]|nr:amino acid ABC transporter permease [Kaistia soli]